MVGYWDILGQRTVIVFDAEMFQEVAAKSEFGGRAVPTSYHTMTKLEDKYQQAMKKKSNKIFSAFSPGT